MVLDPQKLFHKNTVSTVIGYVFKYFKNKIHTPVLITFRVITHNPHPLFFTLICEKQNLLASSKTTAIEN